MLLSGFREFRAAANLNEIPARYALRRSYFLFAQPRDYVSLHLDVESSPLSAGIYILHGGENGSCESC